MDTLLRQQHDTLALELTANDDALDALDDTLRDDVLPQIQLELALTDVDTEWLTEWLTDTASVFRLLRRHKFIRPFALEEIRAVAIWRLRVLRPILLLPVPALFHCLPPPMADPYGRPIVVFKLASIQSLTCSVQDAILQEAERLRLHLRYIRDHHPGSFPLQYLVLVDLDGISIQTFNLDLSSWVLTDIIPRYPGMLAAVFILNHSWLYSGAWAVARRVLPSSIIARVFFPSKAQLVSYCSPANLPAEYGGSLPTLDQIGDALRSPYQTQHFPPPPIPSVDSSAPPPAEPVPQRNPSTIVIPPMSPQNPFFGYPAIVSASSPHTIRHVQRGPRELLRTLAVLWWRRWKRWVWTWCGCAFVLVLALRLRRGVRLEPVRVGATMTSMVAAVQAFTRALSWSRDVRA